MCPLGLSPSLCWYEGDASWKNLLTADLQKMICSVKEGNCYNRATHCKLHLTIQHICKHSPLISVHCQTVRDNTVMCTGN